jgi:predicted peptidase
MEIEKISSEGIIGVAAITEVFPEGQKVIAAAINCGKNIRNSDKLKEAFSVEGRTITKVYANTVPGTSPVGKDGCYVILELSREDKEASTIVEIKKEHGMEALRRKIELHVHQLIGIDTVEGETYYPVDEPIISNQEINPVVDSFISSEFLDNETGISLKYNLFIPKGYDGGKAYPMVVFLHDRGVCSERDNLGLIQGLGGVIWASPLEQEMHECFVLVPQYPTAIVNDEFEATLHLEATVRLIKHLMERYGLDEGRLYGTGQSMGCMSLLEIAIRHPELFTALLLCSGQWNPETIPVLKNNKLWVLVSEGDDRAFNGMNACMAKLQAAGAQISRQKWDGRLRGVEAEAAVKAVIAEGNNIKYTVYKNGTVVPANDQVGNPMFMNHMYTWRLVYTIDGLRDWLFEQTK